VKIAVSLCMKIKEIDMSDMVFNESASFFVGNVFGMDLFLHPKPNPVGVMTFKGDKGVFTYKFHDVNPSIVSGTPPFDLDNKIKEWMKKNAYEICLSFGDLLRGAYPAKLGS